MSLVKKLGLVGLLGIGILGYLIYRDTKFEAIPIYNSTGPKIATQPITLLEGVEPIPTGSFCSEPSIPKKEGKDQSYFLRIVGLDYFNQRNDQRIVECRGNFFPDEGKGFSGRIYYRFCEGKMDETPYKVKVTFSNQLEEDGPEILAKADKFLSTKTYNKDFPPRIYKRLFLDSDHDGIPNEDVAWINYGQQSNIIYDNLNDVDVSPRRWDYWNFDSKCN